MIRCIDGEVQGIHELDAVHLQIGGKLVVTLIGGADLEGLEAVIPEVKEVSCIPVLRIVAVQDDTDQRMPSRSQAVTRVLPARVV